MVTRAQTKKMVENKMVKKKTGPNKADVAGKKGKNKKAKYKK